MKYVIDASIGFKWEVIEASSIKDQKIRDDYRNALHDLIAPELFPTKVANALLVAERRGRILTGQGLIFLADLLTTLPRLDSGPSLLPRTYAIAELKQTSVYDGLDVALAEREGCQMVTADDKLVRKLQPHFPFVVPLSSLP